jgi:hypothetical protein
MAKGQKSGGRNFKSGISGNPNGRPKLPKDLRTIRSLTAAEFTRETNHLLFLTEQEIETIIQNSNESVFRRIMAKSLKEALKNADLKRLEFITDRLIGKPKFFVDPIEPQKKNYHAEIMQLIHETEEQNIHNL